MRRAALPFVLALAAWPSGAMAQTLGKGEEVGLPLGQLIGLIIFLALLVSIAFFLTKWRGQLPLRFFTPAEKRRMKLVEALRLGPQAGLYLVAVDGREKLIAVSPAGATEIVHEALVDTPLEGGAD